MRWIFQVFIIWMAIGMGYAQNDSLAIAANVAPVAALNITLAVAEWSLCCPTSDYILMYIKANAMANLDCLEGLLVQDTKAIGMN